MRASSATPAIHAPIITSHWETWGNLWARYREMLAGFCIIVGLCCSIILPSLLPIHWWMAAPVAIFGGLIRQRSLPRSQAPLIPLWAFFAVIGLFVVYAVAANPLTAYGQEKLTNFAIMAAAAYIGARRQAPLTAECMLGMRWGLLVSLILGITVVYVNRQLFLEQQLFGAEELRQSVSVVSLPLVLAMAACVCIPRTLKPLPVLLGGLLLLGGAVLEILIRGRFHAFLLVGIAVFLVLAPPWKGIFGRIMICAFLAILGYAVYINILPMLGDSFDYLRWMEASSLAGRGPAWEVALHGFKTHPLGQGFGSFENAGAFFPYPHNVVLEAAYEMGMLGLIAMLAIYGAVVRRFWQLWLSPPHRALAAVLIVVFLHILKAGDISSLAFHWVFLYLLVVSTPVARTWPLLRGEVVV